MADLNSLPSSSNIEFASSLKNSYLLIIIGEPFSLEHHKLIVDTISLGLQKWNSDVSGINLDEIFTNLPDLTSSNFSTVHKYHEKIGGFEVVILFHPTLQICLDALRNCIQSPVVYRHVIHSGHVIQSTGDWILDNDLLSCSKFCSIFQEQNVIRLIKQQKPNPGLINLFLQREGDWNGLNNESICNLMDISISADTNTQMIDNVFNFITELSKHISPYSVENLQHSDVVGNIRFSRPTFYIFPAAQGNCSLFGVNGFNMLIDGGYSRNSCFWDFTRHLDSIDAILVTHLGLDATSGIQSMIKRKLLRVQQDVSCNAIEKVHLEIGYVYFNAPPPSTNSFKKDELSLLINLTHEGQKLQANLEQLKIGSQNCVGVNCNGNLKPVNLYHKVGHGSLDMYILNPVEDAKEIKEFKEACIKTAASMGDGGIAKSGLPFNQSLSVSALLVWHPTILTESITRILFPGILTQSKLFSSLEKVCHLNFVQHPVASVQSFSENIMKTKPANKPTSSKQQKLEIKKQTLMSKNPIQVKQNKETNSTKNTFSEQKLTSKNSNPVKQNKETTSSKNTFSEQKILAESNGVGLHKPDTEVPIHQKSKKPNTNDQLSFSTDVVNSNEEKSFQKKPAEIESSQITLVDSTNDNDAFSNPPDISEPNSLSKFTELVSSTSANVENFNKNAHDQDTKTILSCASEMDQVNIINDFTSSEKYKNMYEVPQSQNNLDSKDVSLPKLIDEPLIDSQNLSSSNELSEQQNNLKNNSPDGLDIINQGGISSEDINLDMDKKNFDLESASIPFDNLECPHSLPEPAEFFTSGIGNLVCSQENENATDNLHLVNIESSSEKNSLNVINIDSNSKNFKVEDLSSGDCKNFDDVIDYDYKMSNISSENENLENKFSDIDKNSTPKSDDQCFNDNIELQMVKENEINITDNAIEPQKPEDNKFIQVDEISYPKSANDDLHSIDFGSAIEDSFKKNCQVFSKSMELTNNLSQLSQAKNIENLEENTNNCDIAIHNLDSIATEKVDVKTCTDKTGIDSLDCLLPSDTYQQESTLSFDSIPTSCDKNQTENMSEPLQPLKDIQEPNSKVVIQGNNENSFDPVKEWGEPLGLPFPTTENTSTKNPTLKKDLNTLTRKSTTGSNIKPNKGSNTSVKTSSRTSVTKSVSLSASSSKKSDSANNTTVLNAKPTTAIRSKGVTSGSVKPITKTKSEPKSSTRSSPAPLAKPPATSKSSKPSKSTSAINPSSLKQSGSPSKVSTSVQSILFNSPIYIELAYIPQYNEFQTSDQHPAYAFFCCVRARYYVLSSISPSIDLLNAFLDGCSTWCNSKTMNEETREITLIPTYDTDFLRCWIGLNRERMIKLRIEVAPSASRCMIKLQNHEHSCSAYRLEF